MVTVIVTPLRPPTRLASRRARMYWTVRAGVGWFVIIAVLLSAWAGSGENAGLAILVVVTGVVAAAHLSVMPQWRFRVHRWEVTATAVYTQAGWFKQERRIAPVARVQTVDTQRGPFEQLFGLANVTVTTASAAGPLKIHALDRAVADALVDELTARTQAAGGDAT